MDRVSTRRRDHDAAETRELPRIDPWPPSGPTRRERALDAFLVALVVTFGVAVLALVVYLVVAPEPTP